MAAKFAPWIDLVEDTLLTGGTGAYLHFFSTYMADGSTRVGINFSSANGEANFSMPWLEEVWWCLVGCVTWVFVANKPGKYLVWVLVGSDKHRAWSEGGVSEAWLAVWLNLMAVNFYGVEEWASAMIVVVCRPIGLGVFKVEEVFQDCVHGLFLLL